MKKKQQLPKELPQQSPGEGFSIDFHAKMGGGAVFKGTNNRVVRKGPGGEGARGGEGAGEQGRGCGAGSGGGWRRQFKFTQGNS